MEARKWPDGTVTVDFTPEIDAGVAWLSRLDPSWHTHIDLDALNLERGHACIVGQLAMKTFRDVVEGLGDAPDYMDVLDGLNLTEEWSRRHGFSLEDLEIVELLGAAGVNEDDVNVFVAGWEELTLQWQDRIQRIRQEEHELARMLADAPMEVRQPLAMS